MIQRLLFFFNPSTTSARNGSLSVQKGSTILGKLTLIPEECSLQEIMIDGVSIGVFYIGVLITGCLPQLVADLVSVALIMLVWMTRIGATSSEGEQPEDGPKMRNGKKSDMNV